MPQPVERQPTVILSEQGIVVLYHTIQVTVAAMTASTRGNQATSQISASRPCSRSCGFLFESVVAGVSVSDIFAGIYYSLLDVKVARGDGKYELRIRKGGWWPWIPACAGRTGVGWWSFHRRGAEGRGGSQRGVGGPGFRPAPERRGLGGWRGVFSPRRRRGTGRFTEGVWWLWPHRKRR